MPPVTHIPFYLDWPFWDAVVAAIAIVLSQLPPVRLLLKPAKLELELYSRAYLLHKVGNPNMQLHLIINNIGGRAVKIKGITSTIQRDGKLICSLTASSYYQKADDKTSVLFTPFSLKPEEEWGHIVIFLNFFPREDEKKFRSAESQLKEVINTKLKQVANKNEVVEADNDQVSVFSKMFDRMFIWQPGEYEATISIEAVPVSVNIKKSFRFTLFESDSAELAKSKDDYKSGDGIYWESGKHPGVGVPVNQA